MKSFFSKNSTALSIFFAWYIVLALNLNLTVSKQQLAKTFNPSVEDFLSLFKVHNIDQLLIFLFCYFLIKRVIALVSAKPCLGMRDWALYSVPAILFSSFMIVGFSFKTTGSATCIIFSKYQLFKSLFAGSGYFILFLCLVIVLFDKLDKILLFATEPASTNSHWNYFYSHPFIISYLILFACYIPYIVISYPALFMGDTPWQIIQGYNLKLVNHHPVFHTLLIHIFIVLGKLIHSYNFGIFLFAFFQLNLLIFVESFLIMVLTKYFHLKLKYTLVILLYFLVHPFVQNYMMLITKDILFAIVFLLFLLFFCLFLEQKKLSAKHYLIWIMSMLGMILFRNDGIYLIIPTLLYLLCLNVSKRQVGLSLMMMSCFFLIWHHVVFPFFNIKPGSVREMLSIPFQQTARYVKYMPKKVTRDEMVAIDAVLDYKIIGKKYNPNTSDPVKNTYKEKATKEQRLRYFKTWMHMFNKEPKVYIEAFIANKYEYFYPVIKPAWFYSYGWSATCIKNANKHKEIPFEFHHLKEMEKHRAGYERIRTKIYSMPIINFLGTTPTYVWTLILVIFYILKQGNKNVFALLIPFLINFLVFMAGPCNGSYIRYVYPWIVTFPFLFVYLMYLRDKDKLGGM